MSEKNVSISGAGKVSGGIYGSISISGSGEIDGDVEAKMIETSGSCEIKGNAKVEQLTTAGTCEVTGVIEAREISTAGACSVEGDVRCDLFECSGSQEIGDRLSARDVRIAGSCKVGKDVEADKFVSDGSFEIAGLLSADEIDIRLHGNCRAREIGGERIAVRRNARGFDWRGPKLKEGGKKIRFSIGCSGSGVLETELIEGDEILLEWTRAKTVRGKQIVIGEGCEIERVEYSEALEVDEPARVEERVKL